MNTNTWTQICISVSLKGKSVYCQNVSLLSFTEQKMKFSSKDFFSKCEQIRIFGHIYWRNP